MPSRGVCFVIDRHKAGFLWVVGEPPMPGEAVVYAETERPIEYTDWQTIVLRLRNLDTASHHLIDVFGGKITDYRHPMLDEDAADLIATAVLNG